MTGGAAAEALSGFRRQGLLDAWGEPRDVSDALSGLRMDLYDAPALGGRVVAQYDAPDVTGPDTLPAAAVELQTAG